MELKKRIKEFQPQMIRVLEELVRYESVSGAAEEGAPYGVENARCLKRMLEICEEQGLRTHNMDGYMGWAEYGEGQEMIAVATHLDVVAGGDGWTVCEPFEPVIKDGKMYGRGTMDNKGPGVIALFALKALMEEGFSPKRRVRLLFGCDEENGSSCMKYYCQNGGEAPVAGFTPDASFPLIQGEKGHMKLTLGKCAAQKDGWKLLSMEGGVAANVVPQYAKARVLVDDVEAAKAVVKEETAIHITWEGNCLVVEADGVSAHASKPHQGENAIGRLCLYLKNLPLAQETKEAIGFVADNIGMETTGETLKVNLWDEPSGPLTLNLGMVSTKGTQDQIEIQIVLDSRVPVTFGYDDLVPAIKEAFEKGGWTPGEEFWSNAIYKEDDSEIVQNLLSVYRKVTGDFTPGFCIGGGTYAKDIPNILAFGAEKKDADHCIHGADEFIGLEQMVESGWIFAEAIKALAE